jgi:polysaccharide biosynthesis transport protein
MKEISPQSTTSRVFIVPDDEDPVSKARLVEAEEVPGFRDYWQVLKKHKLKVAACFFGAIFLTAIVVFSLTPVYTARTKLVIDRQDPQVVNIKQVVSEPLESSGQDNFYESQYEMLKSRSLAADVIKQLKLDKNPSFANSATTSWPMKLLSYGTAWLSGKNATPFKENDPNGVDPQLINTYQGMVQIEPVSRSRLVNISVSSPDPPLAASIANAHAKAYIEQGVKLRSQASEGARQFLESKLAELKDRVQKSEAALNQFRRGKGIISLDDKENIVIDRLADLNKRLTEAEADRIGFESQARLIKQRDYDSLPAVISNPLIQGLKQQVVTLEAEYANLSAQFKPGYPKLAQLKAQLDEAKQRLAQQIKAVVEGINSAYYASAGKEGNLRAQMNKQKADALALKDASVDYAILAREADTNSQLYNSVLERMKEIGVAAAIPSSNISILDSAEIPHQPSYPQKKISILLAALMGLMGGVGLAFISEHFDNTLRTPEEVERYLRIRNLVVVPDFFALPKGQPARKSFTGRRDSRLCVPGDDSTSANMRLSIITEAYRKLRTSIFLSRSEEPPKTILFTSGAAGEGKTMTVSNTAIMFAQLGHRVLIIDADLRRPACHKALRVQNDRGLTDYLTGRDELTNVIKPTSVPNLYILGCGSIPPNPTEIIGSGKMRELLALLKNNYDFILIDSPPVIPVSDAVVLSSIADGVVLVVRGQNTPKHIVKAALSELHKIHENILGVVLNRVDVRSAEYSDYYQYYGPGYYSSARLT